MVMTIKTVALEKTQSVILVKNPIALNVEPFARVTLWGPVLSYGNNYMYKCNTNRYNHRG